MVSRQGRRYNEAAKQGPEREESEREEQGPVVR